MTAYYSDSSPGERKYPNQSFEIFLLYRSILMTGQWGSAGIAHCTGQGQPAGAKKNLNSMLGCAKNCLVTAGKALHSCLPLFSFPTAHLPCRLGKRDL